MMKKEMPNIEIACQQVLTHDASVFSIQWTVIPEKYAATLTPDFVLERYFSYLQRFTFSMVRPAWTESGLEFRLLSTKLHLLAFSAPIHAGTGGVASITFHICGGPFVQSKLCDRGCFSFITEKIPGGVKVIVRLSEYHPRLLGNTTPSRFRKNLYRLTQAFIHKVATTRFLAYLYRELAGEKANFTIVTAHVQAGEDI
jgi:hypothetical protein